MTVKIPMPARIAEGSIKMYGEVTLHRVLQRSALIISGQITFEQAIIHGLK